MLVPRWLGKCREDIQNASHSINSEFMIFFLMLVGWIYKPLKYGI